VIDPPFSDARSWREFVTPVETKVFVSEQVQPTLTVEGSQQAANLALASERVVGELKGKRYELMGVGMKSLDRRTEGGFNRSSQHSSKRGCDAEIQAAFGSVCASSFEIARPTPRGTAREL
jgi:hypothetical protein